MEKTPVQLPESQSSDSHPPVTVYQPVYVAVPPKDKTTAVLLAVFLGFWTWVYTYRRDAWKFWVGLGVTVGLVVLALPTLFLSLLVLPLWIFIQWLWAIIDVASKPSEYYWNFNTSQ